MLNPASPLSRTCRTRTFISLLQEVLIRYLIATAAAPLDGAVWVLKPLIEGLTREQSAGVWVGGASHGRGGAARRAGGPENVAINHRAKPGRF